MAGIGRARRAMACGQKADKEVEKMRYKNLINCTEADLPQWIQQATVEDAVIEIKGDSVRWHGGVWHDGGY
jgi:hypothetical protein